ncbi:ABC-three component system middle component 1 [Fusobacterium sp.]|uniref:ABC-three component system middle component 1 n=1 Tax=Fusobacterium sp. TaxID=68766 RepID=UPI0028FF7721|nr:ABC-three component system middle component 1 [Fusobacterium sp.]MDU1911752.1 ABC-three component system middle component 1 [Fusobacterium sp.]
MIEIINKIFNEKKYEKIYEKDEFYLYECREEMKTDFYLLYFLNYASELEIEKMLIEKYSEMIYEIKKEKKYKETIDKNLSLVLFLKISKKNQEDIKKLTYEIEESKMYFKRYLLNYTEDEEKKFFDFFSVKDTIEKMKIEIKKTDNFEKFKNGEISFYNLLIKLYIKIPILEYEFKESDLLEDFHSELNNELKTLEDENLINYIKEIKIDTKFDIINFSKYNLTEDEVKTEILRLSEVK